MWCLEKKLMDVAAGGGYFFLQNTMVRLNTGISPQRKGYLLHFFTKKYLSLFDKMQLFFLICYTVHNYDDRQGTTRTYYVHSAWCGHHTTALYKCHKITCNLFVRFKRAFLEFGGFRRRKRGMELIFFCGTHNHFMVH